MQVVIPLAGKGTRLMPATKYVPKPLLGVGGKPILDHVVSKLAGLDVEELVFITGHLKEQVEVHARKHYQQRCRFVEQVVQDGTASAIKLAQPHIHGPVLIIFVDTLFDADLDLVNRVNGDSVIWVKEVEDYQRFGVCVTDDRGRITRIVEKPSEPVSKLAGIGLYYLSDSQLLFEGIDHTMAQPKNKGEWYLTDAFQYMIDRGATFRAAEVEGWYDCGKLETMLETNSHLLKNGLAGGGGAADGVTLIDPVRIADGVDIQTSTIGPNVTLEEGVVVRNSVISDTIVGRGARITDYSVKHALIGEHSALARGSGEWIVAARDEIADAG